MEKFVLVTDITADMPEEFYEESKIPRVPFPLTMGGEDYDFVEKTISFPDFYNKIRQGGMPTTSQVSQYEAERICAEQMKEGNDILYICFSSGLSGTYDNMNIVKKSLKEKFPERTMIVIDTLCGAGGEGILVYYANKMKQQGCSMKEIQAWLENNKLCVNQYFICNDLFHLRKSGRLSKIEALLGTLLGIKPILDLNKEGRIVPVAKMRGLKKAYVALVNMVVERMHKDKNDFLLVSHGDNLEKAKIIGEMLQEKTGYTDIRYCNVNYLVGAHAGPDVVAVFFIGEQRLK